MQYLSYEWGNVYLPHGTELRLRYKDVNYLAEVVNGTIVYNNIATSPWGFMKAVKRTHPLHPSLRTGNPFSELWVKRPDDADWLRAKVLRDNKK